MKKKILIFHPYLAPYRIDNYNALSDVFDVNVLLTGGRGELATLGYDLDTVNRQARFSYSYYSKGLRLGRHLVSTVYSRIIKKFRPDILLAHELGLNTLIAILLKPFYKYKLFVTIDDSPKMIVSYGKMRKLLQRFVVRHANGLIVVNPQVKDILEKEFEKYKCRYHYLPIIQDEKILADKFRYSLDISEKIFKQNHLHGKKVILFIGRLIKVKAPDLLLRVFSALYKPDTDLRLVFIGDGILESRLKEFASTNNLDHIVYFAGRLTGRNLYAWYNIGQVLVLPSQHEPFGAVVNEALAAGCQVVTSDSVGSSCLVDASNGRVFRTNDEDHLKAVLSEVLNNTPSLERVRLKNHLMNETFAGSISELIQFMNE